MAIINVVCKLFMMVLRERINGWVEESGMLGFCFCFNIPQDPSGYYAEGMLANLK